MRMACLSDIVKSDNKMISMLMGVYFAIILDLRGK